VERQRAAETVRGRQGFAQSEDAKTDRPKPKSGMWLSETINAD